MTESKIQTDAYFIPTIWISEPKLPHKYSNVPFLRMTFTCSPGITQFSAFRKSIFINLEVIILNLHGIFSNTYNNLHD